VVISLIFCHFPIGSDHLRSDSIFSGDIKSEIVTVCSVYIWRPIEAGAELELIPSPSKTWLKHVKKHKNVLGTTKTLQNINLAAFLAIGERHTKNIIKVG